MPSSNQINPFDYNIDNFDSGFLGPITDSNFRNYLFSHNLSTANPVVSNALGGNPWQDLGTEYNTSLSVPNVVDVPNLLDVAQTPSVYNNLTNPRQVNLAGNLQNLNPDVQNILGVNTPIQAGLGQDATSLFNTTTSNIDLPQVQDVSQIASDINNFTTPKYDNLDKNPTPLELVTWNPVEFAAIYNQYAGNYDTSYGVPQVFKIGYVGNVEEWVEPSGILTTTNEVRDVELFSPANNKWGPSEMISYSYGADQLVTTNTGLIQYSTAVQGDFRDQLLSRTLGVGIIPFSTIGSGINFKPDGQNISQLDEIARKQRGKEVLGRIKLNFVDKTIGALNTSPFSLLSGGNLIQQNYVITVPKSKLGKAAQFAADLAGFNLPTSIIPDGAFGDYGINASDVDITNDILDYTGSGQKSLLYNALFINKYGPKLESADNPPNTKLGKFIQEKLGAGQQPNTTNYLDPRSSNLNTGLDSQAQRSSSLIDKINSAIRKKPNQPETPTEMENPTINETVYGGFYGEREYPKGKSFSDDAGFDPEPGLIQDASKPITTYIGTGGNTSLAANSTTNESFDWRYRENNFKKGLLKYTQELINKSATSSKYVLNVPNPLTGENIPVVGISPSKMLKTSAGAIGYFDTDSSFKGDPSKDGAHITGANDPFVEPKLPSKGNQVRNIRISKTDPSGLEGGDLYCRSWTSRRKYYNGGNLIRNSGNWWKVNSEYANLMTLNWGEEQTGHPKIAWDSYDNIQWCKQNPGSCTVMEIAPGVGKLMPDPSKVDNKTRGLLIPYMFSIENLAWKDAPQKVSLPHCEIGPNGGRIMWFPPYDIEFSDNTSVSWDTTNFIGRGEPIYTYNHTERSGNLSWKIVIDHPEVLNNIRDKFANQFGEDDGIIHSFFAGCDADTISKMFEDLIPPPPPPPPPIKVEKPKARKPKDPPPPIQLHFENCVDNLKGSVYESPNGIGRAVNFEYEVTKACIGGDWAETPLCSGATGLNVGVENKLKEMAKFLATEDGKNYSINIFGYTSASNPSSGFNTKLATDRAQNTQKYLYKLILEAENGNPPKLGGTNLTYQTENSLEKNPKRYIIDSKGQETTPKSCKKKKNRCYQGNSNCTNCGVSTGCCDGNPCEGEVLEESQANSKKSKKDRFAQVELKYEPSFQQALLDQLFKEQQKNAAQKDKEALTAYEKEKQERIKKVASKYINECDYFQALEKNDPFIYKTITEKIKNFHPAFHAITPEGFNSRLTFLQQCTRQGPQMLNDDQPQNMVFGRPPICVLRIGDFYHTKIVIDSMNFSFDPLQWDLNPEGIGVQPMVAKIDMGFKFIGGSSLGGPIKQLQNAVSYNFFANTGVYNPAKPLEKLLGARQTFIYGAFLTPEQANKMYEPAKEEEIKDTNTEAESSNTENTNPAAQNTELKDKITTTNTNTTPPPQSTTQGDSKPATPPPSDFEQIKNNLGLKGDNGQIIGFEKDAVGVEISNVKVKTGPGEVVSWKVTILKSGLIKFGLAKYTYTSVGGLAPPSNTIIFGKYKDGGKTIEIVDENRKYTGSSVFGVLRNVIENEAIYDPMYGGDNWRAK